MSILPQTPSRPQGDEELRGFSYESKYRFYRDERAKLLERVGGPPDQREALLIDRMIDVLWCLRECYAEAKVTQRGEERGKVLDRVEKFERLLKLLDRDLAMATRARETSAKPQKAQSLAEKLQRHTP